MRTPHDQRMNDTIGTLVPAFLVSVIDGVEVAA